MTPLATLVERAGFAPGVPVTIARVSGGITEAHIAGAWPSGQPVADGDRFYLASLAKQVTGAALALLVRDGRIDPDRPVADYIGGLPPWSALITPRQLAHHSSGLPAAGVLEADCNGDWTEAFVIDALNDLAALPTAPGAVYSYSNAGYVLLARLVGQVSGMPLDAFAAARLFGPLGLKDMGFGSAAPQLAMLGPRLPLSLGDGGLWSTAREFARWLEQQNRDTLGIAELVAAPGRLSDGSRVDYGWGLGLRRHRGEALLIHGGEWPGAAAKAVRSPTLGIAVVGMAAGGGFERLNQLVGAALEDMG